MDLYEVLDQVVELLRSRKRITYRMLGRQFDLDDTALNDLKEELLFAHPEIRDEAGRGLVWTDEASPPSSVPSAPMSTPILHTVTEDVPPSQEPTPLSTQLSGLDAERRQLTVMFCDLVDSTALSRQLDPEDLREVVRAYQQVVSDIIQRYDGHVAQLLGDGLLVYFGYPQAHEDDPQRAIHAGLGIGRAVEHLNRRLEPAKGIRLAVRLGIHTGLVVIGEMGGSGRQEQLAMGEAPNIAARIQGLAKPNTVVVSEATYRLIEGYFDCQDLGHQQLRGVAEPFSVYGVLRASDAQSRLDIASVRGLTPLIGRESEVTLLLERWEQAKDGQGQVILLSGEAGIGKSRLVQVLKDLVADQAHTRLECRSSPYYQHSALYPIIHLLQRTLQWQQVPTLEEKLEKLEQALAPYRFPLQETVPFFATLLSLSLPEDRYPPLALSSQLQRQKTLELLVTLLLAQAESQPLVFILEDLHWVDPTTLAMLDLLIDQTPTVPIFTLLTCRPTFQSSWSPRPYLLEMMVNRLSRHQIAQLATHVASGKTLPAAVIKQLADRTDGVPLYVEEMTKVVLESGILKETNGRYELSGSLSSLAIPATLQDSLMSRLDRLMTAKVIAQLGATIGRQFSYELLQAVSQLDDATLQRELGRLVEAELVYQRGLPPQATYTFKHALIQDAAYQALLKSTRQQYHQRLAQILEERFPETTASQPELVAHHYTESGLIEPAIAYWQRAGQQARQHSANLEAVAHLTRGLELLMRLPDTLARTQRELDFQMALCPVLMATRGYAAAEVGEAYTRMRTLCQHVGASPQLFSALSGLCIFHITRAELRTACELAEQFLSLAQQQPDPAPLLVAHQVLGTALFYQGEFAASHQHLAQGIALYNPQQHHALIVAYGHDVGVVCLSYAALALGCLGALDEALKRSHEALTLAQEVSHPYSLAWAFNHAARFHHFRREDQMVYERTEVSVALSTEKGFGQFAAADTILRGWVEARQEHGTAGIAHMRQGVAAWQASGAVLRQAYWLSMLAEVYGKHGEAQEGLRVLAEAQEEMNKTDEQWYKAELHRLKGELLLLQSSDNHTEAETSFHQAITIARHQQAKFWELRATTSLARLWQSQDKRQDAYDLLAPVYEWFSEGFDTADFMDAKQLLAKLSVESSSQTG